MNFLSNKGQPDFYYMEHSYALIQNNHHWTICSVSIQNKHCYWLGFFFPKSTHGIKKTNIEPCLITNFKCYCNLSLYLGSVTVKVFGELHKDILSIHLIYSDSYVFGCIFAHTGIQVCSMFQS